MLKNITDIEKISSSIGAMPDYVQGGGGNTSVKLDDNFMAIKASGFELKEVTSSNGFAVVNYKKLREYYEKIDLSLAVEFEKESTEFTKKNVVELENYQVLRPSIETGFHSLLDKIVIHSHSVYANILCCASEGEQLVKEIFKNTDITTLWIAYNNPGFNLTIDINKKLKEYCEINKAYPKAIFLQNHGLIVTDENCDGCIKANFKVSNCIKEYFKIEDEYPKIMVNDSGDGKINGATNYIKEYIKNNNLNKEFFDKVLFPDQVVYFNDVCISSKFNELRNKVNINSLTGEVIYKTNIKEARTIEETIAAYFYIIEHINKNNLTLNMISNENKSYIKSMESEKYRQKMLKGSI